MMPVGSRIALFCMLSADATIKQHKKTLKETHILFNNN